MREKSKEREIAKSHQTKKNIKCLGTYILYKYDISWELKVGQLKTCIYLKSPSPPLT